MGTKYLGTGRVDIANRIKSDIFHVTERLYFEIKISNCSDYFFKVDMNSPGILVKQALKPF